MFSFKVRHGKLPHEQTPEATAYVSEHIPTTSLLPQQLLKEQVHAEPNQQTV